MALLDVIHYPDPRLRNRAELVHAVDSPVRTLVADMLETMYAAPGVGLAAVQVNAPLAIIVIDISERKDEPLCLINPELIRTEGEQELEEGCLSVPGVYEIINRYESITVRALDREGVPFERDAEGLLSVCIQHEMDHLEGRLFVDYLSQLKRRRIRKKVEKQQRSRA